MLSIKENISLKEWSWWKIGGVADYFCEPQNQEELQESLLWAKEKNIPFSVLGGGTNVLISDDGVEGLVIATRSLKKIYHQVKDGFLKIVAQSGVPKFELMSCFKKHQLSPALFLTGLPGDVGGGIVMNAGVSKKFNPSQFSEIVNWFEVVTFEGVKRYNQKDVHWDYRLTSGWDKGVIFQSELIWPMEAYANLNHDIKVELKKRRQTQPLEWPSCGSVFKNPYPHYAGELIEKSGLKGLKKGDACVSEKHGNFIINQNKANAKDIDDLICEIRETVKKKFDILLMPEVRYFGRWKERVL